MQGPSANSDPDNGGRKSGKGARLIMIETPELAGLPAACRQRLIPAPPRLSRLSAEWIANEGAQGIVFALFSEQPDAWQVCGHLARIGYGGHLFALSPALPNRRMVERELRSDYPALRLSVRPVLRF